MRAASEARFDAGAEASAASAKVPTPALAAPRKAKGSCAMELADAVTSDDAKEAAPKVGAVAARIPARAAD